ncbi:MAG TPA: hypothetical protein DCY94_01480 [Firmicutes bacterium]|nr:hypothetical protein [Bacillota bacterium]
MKIKDLPKSELPRERLETYGAEFLSNEELLSIILRTGTKGSSVKELSQSVLSLCKDAADLKNLTLNTLESIKGLGPAKAVSLLASIELGKRIFIDTSYKDKIKVRNAAEAYINFGHEIFLKKQEHLLAIYLDTHRQVLAHKIIFKGTVNASLVHCREIFKEAFLESASGIIIMHNHPSGNTHPSSHDDQITKELFMAGKTFGVEIYDHIIVSEYDFFSYVEEGRIAYA